MLDELTTGGGLSGTIPDNSGGGIFVGSGPPSSSLTNQVWFKIDGAGRPLGVYMFYNGNWRKIYTGVALGEIRMFSGSFNTYFDGTGLGKVGGDLDGWAVCNGSNGTPNLVGYFAAGGTPSGNAWVTDADGQSFVATGGVKNGQRITPNNLPPLHTQINAHPATVQSGTGHTDTWLSGPGVDNTLTGYPVTETIGSNNVPLPLPAYFAVGFIQFIGYQ